MFRIYVFPILSFFVFFLYLLFFDDDKYVEWLWFRHGRSDEGGGDGGDIRNSRQGGIEI